MWSITSSSSPSSTRKRVAELEASLARAPRAARGPARPGREMTALVHGETALARAEQASQALFGGEITGLSAAEIADIFADVPSWELPKALLEGAGLPMVDLLAAASVAKSKGEARRSLSEGGIYLNNQRAAESRLVTTADALEGKFIVLRKGKRSYTLVKLV